MGKVAIIFSLIFIFFYLLLSLTKNLIKGSISGKLDEKKVRKGTKLANPKKVQPKWSMHEPENARV
jgi:hypothetical protein